MLKKLLAAALFWCVCASAADAGNTPLTFQIDRTLDPAPVCLLRVTSGACVRIGTVGSAGIWTPLGPNGALFAPSATIDTTDAGNVSKGTLAVARLPALVGSDCALAASSAPGTATLTCTKTAGVAFAPSATTDATDAGNITKGTLAKARLPSLSFSDLANQIASSQVPAGLALSSPVLSGTPSTPGFTGYLYGNNGTGWTASPTIPVAALTGVVPASQLPAFSGGALTGTYSNPQLLPVPNEALDDELPLTAKCNPSASAGTPTDCSRDTLLNALFSNPAAGTIICKNAAGMWSVILPGAGTAGYPLTSLGTGACPQYQSPGALLQAPRSSVRQTVQGGPAVAGTATTAVTVPSFLAATSASLSPVFQNITSTTPLTASAAQGSNPTGPLDYVYQYTSNPTGLPALAGSQTVSGSSCTATACTETTGAAHGLVVGATVNIGGCSSAFLNGTFPVATVPSTTTFTVNGPNPQTGTAFASATPTGCTYTVQNYLFENAQSGAFSSSQLVPAYVCGGPISATAGQFVFDYCGGGTGGTGNNAGTTMVGYLAGAVAPLVAIGECSAGASALSGCVGYAYNGYAETIPLTTAPAVGSYVAYSTNLGVGATPTYEMTVNYPVNGYAIGDKLTLSTFDGTYMHPFEATGGRNTIGFTAGASGTNAFNYQSKTGASAAVAGGATGFTFKLIQRRGWGGA